VFTSKALRVPDAGTAREIAIEAAEVDVAVYDFQLVL
jgi:hypothetical protein